MYNPPDCLEIRLSSRQAVFPPAEIQGTDTFDPKSEYNSPCQRSLSSGEHILSVSLKLHHPPDNNHCLSLENPEMLPYPMPVLLLT